MPRAIQGWVILVYSANGRWRIGWTDLFDTRARASQFLAQRNWRERTQIVRGSISVAPLHDITTGK